MKAGQQNTSSFYFCSTHGWVFPTHFYAEDFVCEEKKKKTQTLLAPILCISLGIFKNNLNCTGIFCVSNNVGSGSLSSGLLFLGGCPGMEHSIARVLVKTQFA